MKRFLTILITIAFLIIVIVLGLKNQQLVTVNYIIAQNELRLSTLLAIIFTLGFAGALSLASYFFLKLKMKNRKLHKLNAKQRKELNNVRDRISQE